MSKEKNEGSLKNIQKKITDILEKALQIPEFKEWANKPKSNLALPEKKLEKYISILNEKIENLDKSILFFTKIMNELKKDKDEFPKENIEKIIFDYNKKRFEDLIEALKEQTDTYSPMKSNTSKNLALLSAIKKGVSDSEAQKKRFQNLLDKTQPLKNQLTNSLTQREGLNAKSGKVIDSSNSEIPPRKPAGKETILLNISPEAERQNRVQAYIAILNKYKRKREASFSVKDKISPADKRKREAFIAQLSTALQNFVTSGNRTEILNLIHTNIDQFPGVHLQSILHRFTLEFIEQTSKENVSIKAMDILKVQLKDLNYAKYADKVLDLYKKIKAVDDFSRSIDDLDEHTTVKNLADGLRNDLDHFVNNTKGQLPTEEDYKQFKIQFEARAHSQDDALNKHEGWTRIILSVVAAVTVVGLFVLAAVAIHSKMTKDHFSLFTTPQQDALAKVNRSLSEVDKAINKNSKPKP